MPLGIEVRRRMFKQSRPLLRDALSRPEKTR
jgi:hypothetical protein